MDNMADKVRKASTIPCSVLIVKITLSLTEMDKQELLHLAKEVQVLSSGSLFVLCHVHLEVMSDELFSDQYQSTTQDKYSKECLYY